MVVGAEVACTNAVARINTTMMLRANASWMVMVAAGNKAARSREAQGPVATETVSDSGGARASASVHRCWS